MKKLVATLFFLAFSINAQGETLFGVPFGVASNSIYKVCKPGEIGGNSYCLVDRGFLYKNVLYVSLNLDEADLPAWAAFAHFEAAIVDRRVVDKIKVTTSATTDCNANEVISSITKRFGPPANSQGYGHLGGWQATWDRGPIRVSLLKLMHKHQCVVTFSTPTADARDRAGRIEQSRSDVRPASP